MSAIFCSIVFAWIACSSVHRISPCHEIKTENDARVCAQAFNFMYEQKNQTANLIEAEYSLEIPNYQRVELLKKELVVENKIINIMLFGLKSAPRSLESLAIELGDIKTLFYPV